MEKMRTPIRCAGRPVSLILLAGGRSRRMKRDKAGLPMPEGTLLERILLQVEGYFDDILISLSPGQRLSISRGKPPAGGRPAFRCIEDAVPGQGPMAGILAGLKAASHEVCAVIACDMPDIHIDFLRRLVRKAEIFDVVVPLSSDGLAEPLFAVYRRKVRAKMQKLLASGQRSLLPLLDRVRTYRFPVRDTAWLKNLNTPDDYRLFLKTLKAKPSVARSRPA
jgi:molybdopterin-guanine dinucleotide biosynthesis protein A